MKKFTTIKLVLLVLSVVFSTSAFSQLSESQTFTWTGNVSDDWFNPSNWDSYSVPTLQNDVVITENERTPVIYSSTAQAGNITIQRRAILTMIANSAIQIGGDVVNDGRFNAVNGTVEFKGIATQFISPDLFFTNKVKNLIVNNDVELLGSLSVTGKLAIGAGLTFTTNNYLILNSDAEGTAYVETLPTDADGNARANIKGVVTIQRYIPARKAWRFMGVPIKASTAPSINATFQEGASFSSLAPNSSAGYGILVAGGTQMNGFDPSPTNFPTMKYYDNATNSFIGINDNTTDGNGSGTYISLGYKPAYMVYIRGDRTIDFMQGTNAAITSTTLEYKGELNMGKQVIDVNPSNYTAFSNPYASTIDFGTVEKNNVKNSFYAWDPKLAGVNGLGGYVTVSWNDDTQTYDVTTNASGISQYIPSGAAVFVESAGRGSEPSISVYETDKVQRGVDSVFGRPAPKGISLRANLYEIHTDGTTSILDGTLTTFSKIHSNLIDSNDVKKIYGSGESIGFRRDGLVYGIERRKVIGETDTCFINISQMKRLTYRMEIVAQNLSGLGLTATLFDKYSGTTNNLSVNLDGTTYFDFTVNTDPLSYAYDRFKVIFNKNVTSTPVSEYASKGSVSQPVSGQIVKADDLSSSAVVFPNPVTTNDINVKLNNTEVGTYTFKLFNNNGQLISTKQINYTSKGQIVSLKAINGFVPGKYELKIEGQGKTMTTAIIKQ